MELGKWEYLIVLGGCGIMPLIFSIVHRRILRREGFCFINYSVLVAALPFLGWDIWAVNKGWWNFNPKYILGLRMFGLPIEEFVFFLVIPQICLIFWIGLKKYKNWQGLKDDVEKHQWYRRLK